MPPLQETDKALSARKTLAKENIKHFAAQGPLDVLLSWEISPRFDHHNAMSNAALGDLAVFVHKSSASWKEQPRHVWGWRMPLVPLSRIWTYKDAEKKVLHMNSSTKSMEYKPGSFGSHVR